MNKKLRHVPEFLSLLLELGDVDLLALFCPLHECAKTAGGHKQVLHLAGCRVDQSALLQVWHLATLGFDVTVAHVIAGERFFASDGADLGHMERKEESD